MKLIREFVQLIKWINKKNIIREYRASTIIKNKSKLKINNYMN